MSTERLWAEIHATRDAGARRAVLAVLADALTEAGDPRGEFIAAQLAGAGARAAELVAAHGDAWVGGLRDYACAVEFVDGIAARLELRESGKDPVGEVVGVAELLHGEARPALYIQWLRALPALRRIEIDYATEIDALADPSVAPMVEHVGIGARELGRVLPALVARPAIRSLAIAVEDYELACASPLFARLEQLHLVARVRDVFEVLAHVPRSLAVTIAGTTSLRSPTSPPFAELAIAGDTARVTGDFVIPAVISELPAHVARAIVVRDGDLEPGLVRAARERGIALVDEVAAPPPAVWRHARMPGIPRATAEEIASAIYAFVPRHVAAVRRTEARALALDARRTYAGGVDVADLVTLTSSPSRTIEPSELVVERRAASGVWLCGKDAHRGALHVLLAANTRDRWQPWIFIADDGAFAVYELRGAYRLIA